MCTCDPSLQVAYVLWLWPVQLQSNFSLSDQVIFQGDEKIKLTSDSQEKKKEKLEKAKRSEDNLSVLAYGKKSMCLDFKQIKSLKVLKCC